MMILGELVRLLAEVLVGGQVPPFGFSAGGFLTVAGGENGSRYFKNTGQK